MKPSRIRTAIKLSIAVLIAIPVAMLLDLEYQSSAGIVAILTILPTKQETLKTAVGRALAFVVALLMSFGCFQIWGLSIEAYLIFLILYIWVCQFMKWGYATTVNAVLVSHFVTSGRMDGLAIWNEVLIFAIGVSVGILMNMHLRKNVHHFEKMKKETDDHIREIIDRMADRVNNHDMTDYNGECFHTLGDLLRNAKNMAEHNYYNQLNKYDLFDIEYMAMRERQCVVLYEMYRMIRHLETTPKTAHKISDFLEVLAHVLDEDNDGVELMKRFRKMDEYMKSHDLPNERQEFEDRARLFCFMRNMEEFIRIKMEFIEEQEEKEKERKTKRKVVEDNFYE